MRLVLALCLLGAASATPHAHAHKSIAKHAAKRENELLHRAQALEDEDDDDETIDPVAVERLVADMDVYRQTGCPFAQWFAISQEQGGRFVEWSTNLLTKYHNKWQSKCDASTHQCPVGWMENDHNYDTQLGQGNTLGFVHGKLNIDPKDLTPKVGLFATAASHPVIIRLSDFGADGSIQLGRIAMKLPYTTQGSTTCAANDKVGTFNSWAGEMNLLFTESMDSFPLANYKDLRSFASSEETTFLDSLRVMYHGFKVVGLDIPTLLWNQGEAVMSKKYYSQLPYMLGCDHVMKFALFPRAERCSHEEAKTKCCFPTSGKGRQNAVNSVRNFLTRCDAVFDFSVQVKAVAGNEKTINNAAASWSESYIKVGELVIPSQSTTEDAALSTELAEAIEANVALSSTEKAGGLHKSFLFHPVLTANEHMPAGEVNSFRSFFYSQNAKERARTIQNDLLAMPPQRIPAAVWDWIRAK